MRSGKNPRLVSHISLCQSIDAKVNWENWTAKQARPFPKPKTPFHLERGSGTGVEIKNTVRSTSLKSEDSLTVSTPLSETTILMPLCDHRLPLLLFFRLNRKDGGVRSSNSRYSHVPRRRVQGESVGLVNVRQRKCLCLGEALSGPDQRTGASTRHAG